MPWSSWTYLQGAGDDEENWARGLAPELFWKHVHDLTACDERDVDRFAFLEFCRSCCFFVIFFCVFLGGGGGRMSPTCALWSYHSPTSPPLLFWFCHSVLERIRGVDAATRGTGSVVPAPVAYSLSLTDVSGSLTISTAARLEELVRPWCIDVRSTAVDAPASPTGAEAGVVFLPADTSPVVCT